MGSPRQFRADLSRFLDQTIPEAHAMAVKKIALEVLARVVQKSPVDTGRFRNNWMVGIGSADESTTEGTEDGAVERGTRVLAEIKSGDVVHISNNLPYAGPLEDGHSQQAPTGMLGLTMDEINAHYAHVDVMRWGGVPEE